MVNIKPRSEWGAARARPRTSVDIHDRTGFMVHHTTGHRSDIPAWLRSIQADHMGGENDWADIGYNFLVDEHGQAWEGRGWAYVGAHCPNFNTSDIGVAYLGDGRLAVPAAALQTIHDLYVEACDKSGRTLKRHGHRDGKATECPGDVLYAFVEAGLPGDGVVPAPPSSGVPQGPGGLSTGAVPSFPLPRGSYYGPKSGPASSVSGYYPPPSARAGLRTWQARMADRGWSIGEDGLYGPETAEVAEAFQREKGLQVDGLIGPETWRAAWTARIT